MAIWIDNDLFDYVKTYIKQNWPEKKVKGSFRPHSWQSSRYIQVSTSIKSMDIHYEYYLGKVQIHFEGLFQTEEYKPLLQYLQEQIPSGDEFEWRKWQNMDQGLCESSSEINSWDDLNNTFRSIINSFDPIIDSFITNNEELFPNQGIVEYIPDLSYKIQSVPANSELDTSVKTIDKIPFYNLVIPTYQRPYKWTAKNVNQLISDIVAFRENNSYRLGTLVLYNNEIVDGQQRIVTLSLILTNILKRLSDSKMASIYDSFIENLNQFVSKTKFSNRYSLHNIIENIHVIEDRENDLTKDVLDFILHKCEFVVIELKNISEAFQFFDSQNARGKDLEAHDLLKAYHLRELFNISDFDSLNIDIWQKQRTEFLKDVFLMLFRAKRWSQGKSARDFSKKDIDIFKGISIRDGKRYPFYQMEIIAHVFSTMYSNDYARQIDQNKMEYPFNLDDQIVNGSRFFDMIRHYIELYCQVQNMSIDLHGSAKEIMTIIKDYNGMERTGDNYVKSMFYTLLLYYVDRFGWEEMDKVIPKFFIWAYTLRLESQAVQLISIDKYSTDYCSMFSWVHEAKTPYDIINLSQPNIASKSCTKCEEIESMFIKLNKYKK
jgi:hypothetical protein